MWTTQEVARTIDHVALKPYLTERDVVEACRIGVKYGVALVIVRPCDVSLASGELEGSGVNPGAAVGFPLGGNRPEVKALEARLAIEDGARELDMVMNIGKFLSGDYQYVRKDIQGVVSEANKKDVLVKVVLEVCYLSDQQIAIASEIAREAGADYVKTSTGFGSGGAAPESVDIMINTVGEAMGVKAAGGIRSWEKACSFLDQGCKRLGVGSTEAVLEGGPDPPE
ncbi:MAG: deoxyribose-phosphate aldolase [Spirochaetota bacterium]